MSIEAHALGQLLIAIDAQPADTHPRYLRSAVTQAKYWLTPVQSFRDHLYAKWEQNKEWTREKFMTWARSFLLGGYDGWEIRAICVGDMNYRVENEGFAGWVRTDLHATEVDFEVIINLARYLKTPVGYKVAALVSSVRVFTEGYAKQGTNEAFKALEEDLGILTDEYLNLHYNFLVEVDQKLRQDVPVFQDKLNLW